VASSERLDELKTFYGHLGFKPLTSPSDAQADLWLFNERANLSIQVAISTESTNKTEFTLLTDDLEVKKKSLCLNLHFFLLFQL
jgi:hypothetical protein